MDEIEEFCKLVESAERLKVLPEGERFQVCTTYAVPGEINILGTCSKCGGQLYFSGRITSTAAFYSIDPIIYTAMALPHAPSPPTTLEEFFWYVRRYEKGIYVREQDADGKWRNVALADLPPDRWASWLVRWIKEGHQPVRVREQEEIDADAKRGGGA